MTFNEYQEKLNRIQELAKKNATGTPRELAAKLNVSERTAFRLIKHLKNQNTAIEFCRMKNTYYINE